MIQSPSWKWLAPLIVAALTFLTFLPCLWNEFVLLDDYENFVDNVLFYFICRRLIALAVPISEDRWRLTISAAFAALLFALVVDVL